MAEPNPVCGHCASKTTTEICKDCSAIKYCSVECQQADWVWHKLLCSEYESFKTRPGPGFDLVAGESARLAIYLPAQATKPRFIWITDECADAEDPAQTAGKGWDELYGVPRNDLLNQAPCSDFGGVFREDGEMRGIQQALLVMGKLAGGHDIDHGIRVGHRVDALTPLPLNLCIRGLVGEDVNLEHERLGTLVRGPVLLLATPKVSRSSFIVDLHPSDFTLALKGLIYRIKLHENLIEFSQMKEAQKVKGVKREMRVTGSTDPATSHEDIFRPVNIPRMHPIFTEGRADPLLQKSTWPLLTWTPQSCSPAKNGLQSNVSTPTVEQPAGQGDTLIVRKDGKSLPKKAAELVRNVHREALGPFVALMALALSDTKGDIGPAKD